MGTFFAGCDALRAEVGDGDLEGSVTVDQHYAFEQHENFSYIHPRGGGPKYLSGPLDENIGQYMDALKDAVLGGSLVAAMIENMEDLVTHLDPAAPIDEDPNYFRLRRSGNPKVFDRGAEVYNRPAEDPPMPLGYPGT